jgi:hypothetical protein
MGIGCCVGALSFGGGSMDVRVREDDGEGVASAMFQALIGYLWDVHHEDRFHGLIIDLGFCW